MEMLTATFGVVGAVIIVAALLSGVIERSRFPQVAVFILLGAILGPAGLGLVNLGLDSEIIRAVAILSLVLVLFTDAVSLRLQEVKSHAKLAFMVLGPGTVLTAFVVGLLAWQYLGLPLPAALILGSALASTDPVMIRGLVRGANLAPSVKQALRLESGLNDVVLLPIVLVCMPLLAGGDLHVARLGVDLFLLGPGAGVIVGLFSIGVLELLRKRTGIRRDYESLYSLGVAFLAYALAESVHGSGFLAAFAAGFVITMLDVELCDCFLEYGETTAEMALLLTFVLFGTSVIWDGFAVLNLQTALFAVGVILIRPAIFFATLWGLGLDNRSRLQIAWFGPRGLSSLLLILLPVFAGIAGSEQLFALCCLVVLLSVVIHGTSMMFVSKLPESGTQPTVPTERPKAEDLVISMEQLSDLKKSGEDVIVLDARRGNPTDSAGDVLRVDPDKPVKDVTANQVATDSWLIAFCA